MQGDYAPHSPKKRTVSVHAKQGEVQGLQALDLNDTDLDTTSEQADDHSQASYADFDDEDIVAIDSDDEDDTDWQSGGEESAAEEPEEEVIVEAVVHAPAVESETKVPTRGVPRRKSFEDEDFPEAKTQEPPRRRVSRNISFDGAEGRIVICTADRSQPRRYPSLTKDRPEEPAPDSPKAAHLVPKKLPDSVTDEDEKKKIAWEKPEWATSPVLKPTRKVAIGAKKIEWEKPEWAKSENEAQEQSYQNVHVDGGFAQS